MKKLRVIVLGAGFGGMELSTILSEELGNELDLTLIDKNDSFAFGFSKLDIMFGLELPEAVRLPYKKFQKPGVQFVQANITKIDPASRQVTTTKGTFAGDFLVIALGADYDFAATPGIQECGEFYSFKGAVKLRDKIASFQKGKVIIGISATPFKCPPAPCEAAMMMDDHLLKKGVRDACEITIVTPFAVPIPPSPETSEAILAEFAKRKINFVFKKAVKALDAKRKVAILDDDSEMPFDLYFGIPKHCVPAAVAAAPGLTEEGWIVPSPKNLKTKFPGVYSVGDVTRFGPPKAGLFAEGAAKVAAQSILAEYKGTPEPAPFDGAGICYIEFGGGKIARVDVNFLSGPKPTGKYHAPSLELQKEKKNFGASRRARWFGMK